MSRQTSLQSPWTINSNSPDSQLIPTSETCGVSFRVFNEAHSELFFAKIGGKCSAQKLDKFVNWNGHRIIYKLFANLDFECSKIFWVFRWMVEVTYFFEHIQFLTRRYLFPFNVIRGSYEDLFQLQKLCLFIDLHEFKSGGKEPIYGVRSSRHTQLCQLFYSEAVILISVFRFEWE